MRRDIFRMDREEALAFLAQAPVVQVASTTLDGMPVLRTVHGVIVDGGVAFHSAPAGEKVEALGREAVVSADEVVAQIPSYFVDPERACPATTYYRSVQVHGRLEEVDDPSAKARVLQALMTKFQPERGHVPIDAEHALYRNAVRGILILRVSLDQVDGKGKLGQNRKPDEVARILELLWARGLPGDPRAIDLVRIANPAAPTPRFLETPDGLRDRGVSLRCALGKERIDEALSLLEGTYWNEGVPRDVVSGAILSASAWVGACDSTDALVAMARAVSDTAKAAWIYDVVVRPDWRRRGLGKVLMQLLLDHPALRHARRVRLATKDAQHLYGGFGFRDVREVASISNHTEMILER